MSSTKLIAIILVLSVFDILLLYTNINRQNQIDNLGAQVHSFEQWGYIGDRGNNTKISHPNIELPDSGIFLLIFFTDQGCKSCVENEIRNLNEFYNQFEEHVRVYLVSENELYFEQFGIKFPFETIDPRDFLFNDLEFDLANPIALLIDENGIIQLKHIANAENPEESNSFYKRMLSLFRSIL